VIIANFTSKLVLSKGRNCEYYNWDIIDNKEYNITS
jgi:hypothetical protein